MASHYTCKSCSQALKTLNFPSLTAGHSSRATTTHRTSQLHRVFSNSATRSYHGTISRSASGKPQAPIKLASKIPYDPNLSPVHGLASKLREKAPLMTETYVAYDATQKLVKECARPGEYTIPQALERDVEIPRDETGAHLGVGTGWWYETLGLAPTFINWAQITFIHMYMLQVRFRMFPETHAPVWIQHLTNHTFYAAEDRLVVWHKLTSNGIRQKYLKDIFSQWRAVLLSYDEALVKGDAVLAAALWRNLFGGREDVDFQKVAQIVGYMRRELRRLDAASDDEVANGSWTFSGDPGEEEAIVKLPSRLATETMKR